LHVKDFQSSLGVFGDTYTITTRTFCPFTGHSAAQTSLPCFVYPAS
jgi:hypothetical protein